MAIIKNTALNFGASMQTQQLAKRSSLSLANVQTSLPASAAQTDKSKPDSTLSSLLSNWSDAKQAIDRMGHASQDIKQSKKAMAAERVRRIKDQIKLLMSMVGGDPKAKARQIAQLARELAAAAREYASASGGNSQANAAAPADSAGVQADTAAASSGEQSSTASAASDTAAASGSSAAPEANAGSAATTASASASPAGSTGATQQVSEQGRGKVLEYSRNADSAEAKGDQEFAMEVRRLAALLKALAKQNEVHSHKDPAKSTDHEMEITNDALKEVERSLASIDSANTAVSVSINVVAK